VRHWHLNVVFVVKRPGNKCDGGAWNQFLNKDDAPAPAVLSLPANIKAQVDFFKLTMKRNRNAADPGVFKEETDH
jgi:hypothetical protein